MKKNIFICYILMFCISLVNICFAIDGATILQKMDAVRDYKTSKMNATMEIVDKNKNVTKMSLTSYEQTETDNSLMRYTYPPRLNDTAILMKGDNIWYYNNRTNRVRLLSKSAKKGSMMGSSFSYEDMETDYINDFTATILSENESTYKIKIIPKKDDKSYAYLLATVDNQSFVARKIEYYNKNDLMYKTMISEGIKKINGHYVALKMSMQDIGSQKITNFIIDEDSIEFDIELKNNIFSEQNLKK